MLAQVTPLTACGNIYTLLLVMEYCVANARTGDPPDSLW